MIEPGRDARRFVHVGRCQKLYTQSGFADATTCIHPGAQHKPKVPSLWHLIQPRYICQCRNTWVLPPRHHRQPLSYQRTVHTGKRYHISYGRKGHEVEHIN